MIVIVFTAVRTVTCLSLSLCFDFNFVYLCVFVSERERVRVACVLLSQFNRVLLDDCISDKCILSVYTQSQCVALHKMFHQNFLNEMNEWENGNKRSSSKRNSRMCLKINVWFSIMDPNTCTECNLLLNRFKNWLPPSEKFPLNTSHLFYATQSICPITSHKMVVFWQQRQQNE